MKSLIKDLIPPLVVRALQGKPTQGNEFRGAYESWAEAQQSSDGYDAPQILAKVLAAARAVKAGEAVCERDGVAFRAAEYRFPMVACVLYAYIAQQQKRLFHVADVGGSLASAYFQHKLFFERIPELMWSVVEQPEFVACGNEEFADDRLKFFTNVDEVLARSPIDLVFFSGVLQFFPIPRQQLEMWAANCDWLLIDRTPVTQRESDWLTVQHVPEWIYRARYAHWCLSENKLLTQVADLGFQRLATFPSLDPGALDFEYRGYFFERLRSPSEKKTVLL
jgi:putative methyltransferase (TIGR04325 family)